MLSQIQLCHFSERLMNARLQLHCLYGCTIIFEARKPWICSTICALVFLIPVLLKYAAKLQTQWFKISMNMLYTFQVELSKVSSFELRGTMLIRRWTLKMERTAFMQWLCVFISGDLMETPMSGQSTYLTSPLQIFQVYRVPASN